MVRWVQESVMEDMGNTVLGAEKPPEVPEAAWSVESSKYEVQGHAREWMLGTLERGEYPSASVEILRELGLKCRVVTKSPAALVYALHPVRRRLLAGLRSCKEVGELLNGNLRACLDRYVGAVGTVASSDLTAATDLLPHDLVQSIVDGLAESGKFEPWEITSLRLGTGPQNVNWPSSAHAGEKGRTSPVLTSRGILMGLPTSWAILNLVHLFWWHEALRESSCLTTRRGVFSCFGDDALIVAEPPVLESYDRLISECGGKLSVGKHARSSTRGVYLERLLLFQGRRTRIQPLTVVCSQLVSPLGGREDRGGQIRPSGSSGHGFRLTSW
jgi:hypothetical protein